MKIFTSRSRGSLAQSTFCWWRHNRVLMTSQWPDNCDAITWKVTSNSLDIDFINSDIHGRSCKKPCLHWKSWKTKYSNINATWISISICHVCCNMFLWASCQIRKIAGYAGAENAGNVFPATTGKRSQHVSQHVHDARALMNAGIATWRFPLKSVAGNIPGACATHNFTYLVRGPSKLEYVSLNKPSWSL